MPQPQTAGSRLFARTQTTPPVGPRYQPPWHSAKRQLRAAALLDFTIKAVIKKARAPQVRAGYRHGFSRFARKYRTIFQYPRLFDFVSALCYT